MGRGERETVTSTNGDRWAMQSVWRVRTQINLDIELIARQRNFASGQVKARVMKSDGYRDGANAIDD